jgi:hypothetical protein
LNQPIQNQFTHLEVAKEKASKEAGTIIGKFNNTYDEIQSVTVNALVSIVMFCFLLILHTVMEQLRAGQYMPVKVNASLWCISKCGFEIRICSLFYSYEKVVWVIINFK